MEGGGVGGGLERGGGCAVVPQVEGGVGRDGGQGEVGGDCEEGDA